MYLRGLFTRTREVVSNSEYEFGFAGDLMNQTATTGRYTAGSAELDLSEDDEKERLMAVTLGGARRLGRSLNFDFAGAFGKPVRLINDAAMQALGSYQGGRMLFLGLGTGLGSALVLDGLVVPLELAHLPYKKGQTFEDFVGRRGLRKLGKRKWQRAVIDVANQLKAALVVEEIVIGGGNVKLLDKIPSYARRGSNRNAFEGGLRLWKGK